MALSIEKCLNALNHKMESALHCPLISTVRSHHAWDESGVVGN
jgi:hypothetical protein